MLIESFVFTFSTKAVVGIRVGIEFRVVVVGLVVTRGFVVVGNLFEYLSTYSSTHNCGTERCFLLKFLLCCLVFVVSNSNG